MNLAGPPPFFEVDEACKPVVIVKVLADLLKILDHPAIPNVIKTIEAHLNRNSERIPRQLAAG